MCKCQSLGVVAMDKVEHHRASALGNHVGHFGQVLGAAGGDTVREFGKAGFTSTVASLCNAAGTPFEGNLEIRITRKKDRSFLVPKGILDYPPVADYLLRNEGGRSFVDVSAA